MKAAGPTRRERVRIQKVTGQRPPVAVFTFIAANVVVFFLTRDFGGAGLGIRDRVASDGATWGPPIAELGEWWRLVTGGFLHVDFAHVAMNMILLFLLGRRLERTIGSSWFSGVYVVSLLGGSAGALLLSPLSHTIGASGAVYGIMGAVYTVERASGGDPWNDGIGTLVILNLVFTFLGPNISVGGHFGGLVAGALAGWVLGDRRQPRPAAPAAVLLLGIAVLAVGVGWFGATTWDS